MKPAGAFEDLLDAILWPRCYDAKVLLIGTGSTKDQYEYWPKRFFDHGALTVLYTEAWRPYCEKWARGRIPIINAAFGSDNPLYAPKSWDIVLLNQGIEHFPKAAFESVLTAMFTICSRVALATCPFGSCYDKQECVEGNPYERHIAKNLTAEDFSHIDGWNVEEFGAKDAGDAQIAIWRGR